MVHILLYPSLSYRSLICRGTWIRLRLFRTKSMLLRLGSECQCQRFTLWWSTCGSFDIFVLSISTILLYWCNCMLYWPNNSKNKRRVVCCLGQFIELTDRKLCCIGKDIVLVVVSRILMVLLILLPMENFTDFCWLFKCIPMLWYVMQPSTIVFVNSLRE